MIRLAAAALVAVAAAALPLMPPQTAAPAGYVEPSTCAGCHAGIAASFAQTGMGRSLGRIDAASAALLADAPAYYHPASDRHYTVIERDGRFLMRRHQIGPAGEILNAVEKQIDYVIGSGNHARTFLHRDQRNRLVELPLSWYAEDGGHWAMSPGYDRPDHQDFRRPITQECVFCHNAYPPEAAAADLRADDVVVDADDFPGGIDCQRCHGPGSRHVQAARNRASSRDDIRAAIVNPARLEPARSLEICLQCHLESTSQPLPYAVRRFGRGVFSFRPGEPLADYMLHFDHEPDSGHDDKFEIAGAAYRLLRSACFEQSRGAMTCTSCHNPHDVPRGDAAVTHYREACLNCHSGNLAPEHAARADCIGCHMPKRRTEDAVHVVMTDHWIRRDPPPPGLLAPRPEPHGERYRGRVVPLYPSRLEDGDGPLYLAVAQVTQQSNAEDGIRRLQAGIEARKPAAMEFYFELAKAYAGAGRDDLAVGMFEQALARSPDYWPATHRLGLALARLGRLDAARQRLEAAARISDNAVVLHDLGMHYRRLGQLERAIALLQEAVARDPELAHAYNNLAGMLWQRGDTGAAEQAFAEAIRVQPDLAAAHANLGDLLVQTGRADTGEYHYRQALRADPELLPAHLRLGALLAGQGRHSEARLHLQKAAASTNPEIRRQASEWLNRMGGP